MLKEEEARAFCVYVHGMQKRKYTNEPYFTHPFAVAKIIKSLGYSEDAVCAALLHDTVENC